MKRFPQSSVTAANTLLSAPGMPPMLIQLASVKSAAGAEIGKKERTERAAGRESQEREHLNMLFMNLRLRLVFLWLKRRLSGKTSTSRRNCGNCGRGC